MATTTNRRPKRLSGRWIAVGIVLIVVAIAAALLINGRGQRATATGQTTVPVTWGDLTATVAGSGSVAAEQTVNLAFQMGGTVTEVLVKEGDVVQTGQALARLDDRALQLQVTNARSALESARARLAQAQQGNAKPEDLAAGEAQLASVQASYDKVAKGPTATDRASARAAVRSAQAAYDAAVKSAGTSNTQLASAAATLQKAEANLRQAQANYDRVAGNPDIARRPEALSLQSATIDYQQAKTNYESLSQTTGADAQSRVASASAQLAQARANLDKLTPSAEDLTVAKANLDQAKANLARLTAKATETDQAIQQAAVTQAEQSLQQAQLNLDNAILKAPFAGVVAQINIVPGSSASSSTAALRLIDRDPLHVDLKLSENDVAQVQFDQAVKLTVQSLGGWQTDGKVSYIAPAADNSNGVVTYAVRISFPDNDPKVKVGMTADLNIVTARKDGVLLAPSTALLPKGTGHVVQVPATDASGRPTTPREVEVKTGLSDGAMVEILSGLEEGQEVIALPNSGAPRRASGGLPGF
jgi:RND family efflux transporter MFP subunit